MGSLTIFLFLYFIQLFLFILLKLFICATGESLITKKIYNRVLKGLFFNTIISMTIEGFLDFVVYSVLNINTSSFKKNGEILGFSISIICLFSSLIFVPIAAIWAILTKNE